jgi:hypothetical protein
VLDWRSRRESEKRWGGRRKMRITSSVALRRRRAETSAGNAGTAKVVEGVMRGKKTQRRKGLQTAHGRKSAGQTQGQFERDVKRRRGQYGGAGDAPLMKK